MSKYEEQYRIDIGATNEMGITFCEYVNWLESRLEKAEDENDRLIEK